MKMKQIEELLDIQGRLKASEVDQARFKQESEKADSDYGVNQSMVRGLESAGDSALKNPYVGVFGGARDMVAPTNFTDLVKRRDVAKPIEDKQAILDQYRAAKLGQFNKEQDFGLEMQKFNRQQDLEARKALLAQTQKPSKAQEAVDAAFAKDYNEFIVQGGSADAAKGITQLEDAKKALKEDSGLTGAVGYLPNMFGIKEAFAPKAKATQEAVEEVVQRNLRTILGAQFTEKEGERLISRAYNPKLSEAENIKRIDRLQKQMELAMNAKMEAAKFYEDEGTLRGFKGRTDFKNIVEDFDKDMASTDPKTPGASNPLINEANASAPVWNNDKEKRLEELLRKQAEGNLK
jgi:hypothetical protein